ncbi:hypothetical protein [Polyangium mundeleinium]|uniref:Uncharacterized protein n=1 Tax=Polyangium mundeleinium TaxID=2995306 RepID=A0ABT5ENY1_9BACT|nr:hypothetical protein [Polyangium mundeleinium]MDC0743548.1 hypothetical protein [Polyangium mundeleinium]
MRGTFPYFDPEQCDCGPATGAIRRILHEWASVDWFEPPRHDSDVERAVRLLREHHTLVRSYQPALLSERFEVRPSIGDGSHFSTLCEQASASIETWDWKYGVLKPLSRRHMEAQGWDRKAHARPLVWKDGPRPRTGDLIVKVATTVVWNAYAVVDLRAALPPDRVKAAEWYLLYANVDFIDCLEWQLAENHDRLDANPFFPLVQCYGAGAYPFSLSPTSYVLHAFARPA